MKLRLGAVRIETDDKEMADRDAPQTVTFVFISGTPLRNTIAMVKATGPLLNLPALANPWTGKPMDTQVEMYLDPE